MCFRPSNPSPSFRPAIGIALRLNFVNLFGMSNRRRSKYSDLLLCHRHDIDYFYSTVVIEGTADLDARFFQGHGQREPSPFSLTVALLSNSSMTPLDWNQEQPSHCGLKQSTPNPNSRITINERITVDAQLCCISFTIAIPMSVLAQSQSQVPPPPTVSTSSRANVSGSLWREFGVAVKAYNAAGKVTQTNIAQFLVRYPKASAMTGQSTSGGLARRVSNAINIMGRRRSSNGSLKQHAAEYGTARGRQLRKRSIHSTTSAGTKGSR